MTSWEPAHKFFIKYFPGSEVEFRAHDLKKFPEIKKLFYAVIYLILSIGCNWEKAHIGGCPGRKSV